MSDELKPCPFCAFNGCITSSNTIGTWRFAYCPNCLAEGPARDTDVEAIATWNRRTHPPTGDAAGKDSVDAARVFALIERVPEVGQRVIVVSENWCAPKILEYVAFPHPRLLDRETGRWYWHPERMQWQALSAPVIAAIASLTKTADGEKT